MRLKKEKYRPIVQTSYGPIEGKAFILNDGKEVNAFLGVPFAKPPIGNLRFKKTEPPESWTDVLKTKRYKNRAVQKNYIWDQIGTGCAVSEDCLYLNIITPKQPIDGGYPIIFYIHGGGYVIDTASKYNYKKLAKTLVSKNTIVVTVEYRLAFLGFLCLDDKLAKGNYGVWDVIEALKFIKLNAESFGGDSNRITVVGQSAGSCLADLLSLSPVSRDLFQQKFLMAGFAENSWAISNKRLVIEFCRNKAIELGFRRTNNTEEWSDEENVKCLEFLQQVPARKFGMTMIGDKSIINEMRLVLTPVLDNELFPKSIQELRQESIVKNSIVGVTKHEGLLFLALGRRMANRKFLELCERKVGDILNSYSNNRSEEELITLMAYRELYGIDDMMRKDKKAVQKACVNIMSDLINGIGIQKHCIESARLGGTCYRYNFEMFNPSITSAFNLFLPFQAATHGSELPYFFDVNIFVTPFLKTKADRKVINVSTRLLTNFAKYGNPNDKEFDFEWKPVSAEKPSQHLAICENSAFKEELDIKYYDKLLPVLEAFYSTLSASNVYTDH